MTKKCPKRIYKKWGFLPLHDKHLYLLSHALGMVDDLTLFYVIKICQACDDKEYLVMDFHTIVETSKMFPNAFTDDFREYIQNKWMPQI